MKITNSGQKSTICEGDNLKLIAREKVTVLFYNLNIPRSI